MTDNVWFTYKARIEAENRLSWFAANTQLLLVWYATLVAILAIVSVRFPYIFGKNTDIFAAVASVVLLGVSLVVANRDFRGRAIAMRQNYLDLQQLHGHLVLKGDHTSDDLDRYHTLLLGVENHLDIDDKVFRVFHSGALTAREPTRYEIIHAYSHLVLRTIVTTALYAAPLLAWWVL